MFFPILSIIAAPSVCKALLLAPFYLEKHSLWEFGSINAVHMIMDSKRTSMILTYTMLTLNHRQYNRRMQLLALKSEASVEVFYLLTPLMPIRSNP